MAVLTHAGTGARYEGVAPLIHEISIGALLADKAFDSACLLQNLDELGATADIPPKSNRKVQRDYDAHMYKWRHLVENYFAKVTTQVLLWSNGFSVSYNSGPCIRNKKCDLLSRRY